MCPGAGGVGRVLISDDPFQGRNIYGTVQENGRIPPLNQDKEKNYQNPFQYIRIKLFILYKLYSNNSVINQLYIKIGFNSYNVTRQFKKIRKYLDIVGQFVHLPLEKINLMLLWHEGLISPMYLIRELDNTAIENE